jgi:Flp pilus assembly protein TadG
MAKLQTASEARRHRRVASRAHAEGGSAIACATAAPLIALALAVTADRAQVSRFRTQVQLAADAASLAAAGAIARHPNGAGGDAARVAAAAVFAHNAPRGAVGTPRVAARTNAAMATATVGYDGVAPSNFGSVLGYGAISVTASSTPLALLADSGLAVAP